MEPYLSLASLNTGSGFDSPTHSALTPVLDRGEPAAPAGSCNSRPSKRERKALEKQHWSLLEDTQKPTSRDSGDSADEQQPEEESKEDPHMRGEHLTYKRRKFSDHPEEFLLSPNSNISFSRKSLSDHQRNVEELDSNCQLRRNCFDRQCEDPFSEDCLSSQQNCRTQPVAPKASSEVENTILWKKLSKSSSSAGSAATSLFGSNAHSSLLTIARTLWNIFNGKLLSQEVLSGRGGNDGLSFECCNKHQFIISLSTLGRLNTIGIHDKSCYDSWCLKCRNFLKKSEERAQNMNSTVISSCLSKGFLEIECENSHRFTVEYTKNHTKTWCEECKNEESTRKQTLFKEKEVSEEQRKQREQQRLFEESQKYMQQQQQRKSMSFATHEEEVYFETAMKQVCSYAKKKMEKDMSSENFRGEATHIEIYNVYKILYMPFDVLVKTLCMIDRSQLSSHYRQLALLLHPDKNKHKLSNDAFLKLGQAYELCKQIIRSMD